MSVVLWVLAGLAALVVLVVGKVATDLANKEIQGWMYDLCFIVLHWSRRRLPPELRASLYDDELLEDELRTILYHTYEKKPITALCKGLRFAFGCLAGARRHARASGWRPARLGLRRRRRAKPIPPRPQYLSQRGRRRRVKPVPSLATLIIGMVVTVMSFIGLVRDIEREGTPSWAAIGQVFFAIVFAILAVIVLYVSTTKMGMRARRKQRAKAVVPPTSGRHRAR